MKHSDRYMVFVLLAGLFVLSACSKDEPVASLSKTIEQVKVYKGTDEAYKLQTVMNFNYNQKDGSLLTIESSSWGRVIYMYDNDKFSYAHILTLDDGSDKVNELSGNLINGRLNVCNSKSLGNCMYVYNEATGFLSQASVGSDVVLNYKWQNDGLNIESYSSNKPSITWFYSSKYKFSNVPNNYNIDLNVLEQLVDTRDQYDLIMNSYAQIAGVLGSKCKYVMENYNYEYNYSFDKYGRLSQISISPSVLGDKGVFALDSYTFVLVYKENT